MFHVLTNTNCCTKYEQNPFSIVGLKAVTKVGQMNGQKGGSTGSARHDNTLRLEWIEGKNVIIKLIIHITDCFPAVNFQYVNATGTY